ncbi:MAG: hypothetical protein WCH62_04535 [Candidatus Omnitrophota bacterium]
MSLRICGVVIRIVALMVFVIASVNMAIAQQEGNTQEHQIMTSASGSNGILTDSRNTFIDQLHLRMYEAAIGDLSLCADDQYCLGHAKEIRYWRCVNNVCNGVDKTKNLKDCFDKILDKYSKEDQDQMSSSMCALIESPSALTRQAFLNHVSKITAITENDVVRLEAVLLALKGSAELCERFIKNYVGEYGPQWGYQWYRAMSGCRILAHERTREQEEKDFLTWFGVVQGMSNCSDIINSEMRKACKAPGATSPIRPPGYNDY